MNLIENIDKVDLKLSSIEIKKRLLIYLLLVILISGFNYYFVMDGLIKENIKEKKVYEKMIYDSKHRSPKVLKSKIDKEKKLQSQLYQEIERLENKKLALRSKLDSMKFLYLTDDKFAQFLNRTLKDSVDKGIMLSKVIIKEENSGKQYIGSIYYNKEIIMEGKGDYLKIEEFLRDIEMQNILQKFEYIEINTDVNSTNFNIKMVLFGDKR
jgi:Tfp pilus assembly protein PilO